MEVPKKVYLVGMMTGCPEHNFPAFKRAREALRAAGHEVLCPAELNESDLAKGITDRAHYMRKDIPRVLEADALVLLPGWTGSQGGNTETLVAWQCGKPGYLFKEGERETGNPELLHSFDLEPVDLTPERLPYSTDTDDDRDPRPILHVAEDLINGARRSDYGHPLDDYTRVAEMVNGLFHTMLLPDARFRAEHMPMIIECIKLSREFNCPKRGNRVDGGGYWGVMQMIHDERARRVAL